MNKGSKFAAVIGIGLALASWTAVAQAPAQQPAATASPVAIPPDQQPTKEQLTKLFELTRVHQQVESVMKMIPTMMQKQMNAQARDEAAKLPEGSLTPERQAAIAKVTEKYMEKAFNLITIDELLNDLATIYQHHLSRSDVDGLIVFYSSPTGQHLLDAQPAIMQEYMPVVMKRVQERSKTLADEQTKEMEEVTGARMGQILATPPPPPPPAK
jgi:hypothetical protein